MAGKGRVGGKIPGQDQPFGIWFDGSPAAGRCRSGPSGCPSSRRDAMGFVRVFVLRRAVHLRGLVRYRCDFARSTRGIARRRFAAV